MSTCARSTRSPLRQPLLGRSSVAPRMLLGPDHLVVLDSLAEQRHKLATPALVDRGADGARAIGLDHDVLVLHAATDVRNDVVDAFAARIVGGEIDARAHALRELSHDRALGLVAI